MTLTRQDVIDAALNSRFYDMEQRAIFLDKAAVYNGSKPYFYEDFFNQRTYLQIHNFFPIILSAAEAHFGLIYVYSSTSKLITIL